MEIIASLNIWDLLFNLKQFVEQAIAAYHNYVYAILFVILFMETGFVVTPFLPGDSLLFISGYFASRGQLDLAVLLPVLCLAPILGDSVNYWIGRFVGPKVFHKEKVRFLNKEHLNRAHAFYEKHGGKAVAIGRFVPIIRTFVPFVAGIGKMPYGRFLAFSVIGTLAWIHVCVMAGYLFGGREWVQKHFEAVVIAIIVISLIPATVAFIRSRKTKEKTTTESTQFTEKKN
jgi:membrane-associated protein